MKPKLERIAVAFVIVATASIITVHAANVLLARVAPVLAWPGAGNLAVALCAALVAAAAAVARGGGARGGALVALAAAALSGVIVSVAGGAMILPLAFITCAGGGGAALSAVASRLDASIDGALRRRRVVAVAWAILGLATVVQTGRLSTYMADPSYNWVLTTTHAFWSRHMCMQAYFYAADLNRQGEPNVYAAAHYPGLNPDAPNRSTVAHLEPDDPYQYPPQFLLLPRLVLALSNDFHVIRSAWFAVQALGFLLLAFLFARWYGGEAGRAAAWLIPLVWISVPSMLNFQYGQFHLSTIALAVAALMAFDRRRAVLGGALLASAILAKGFPGILLVPLVLKRRWSEAASTMAWCAGLTALAVAVLGPEPFAAFLQYHLPRVRSGAAFAFHEVWPEFLAPLFAGNISPYSLVLKLRELGVAGAGEGVARAVQGMFTIGVVGLGVLASRVQSRRAFALAGVALVNLAAMTSPAAWGDYVPVGTLWIATFLVARGRGAVATPLAAAAGAMSFLLPGVVPIGNFLAAVPSMVLSIVCTVLLVAFNCRVAQRAAVTGRIYRTAPARELPA